MSLSKTLTANTKRHIVPLLEVKASVIWKGGSPSSIVDQGTMTLVRWKKRVYGLTNHHVVNAYRIREGEPTIPCLALKPWGPIPGRIVYESLDESQPDLAVIQITDESALKAAGKTPHDLPATPNLPELEELTLCVGYPGNERKPLTSQVMKHPIFHVLTTCRYKAPDRLVFRDHEADVDADVRLGGFSGGVIFRLGTSDGYSFTGLIYEGAGPADLKDGLLGTDGIHIFGFPFYGMMLDSLVRP